MMIVTIAQKTLKMGTSIHIRAAGTLASLASWIRVCVDPFWDGGGGGSVIGAAAGR